MGQGLTIRTDPHSGMELRALARRKADRRAARHMLAIANATTGISRAEAALLDELVRQVLRDAVMRYNADCMAGLFDRAIRPRADIERG